MLCFSDFSWVLRQIFFGILILVRFYRAVTASRNLSGNYELRARAAKASCGGFVFCPRKKKKLGMSRWRILDPK